MARLGLLLLVLGAAAQQGPRCGGARGLSRGQHKLCALARDHAASVARAGGLGARECQRQFRQRRWNCSGLGEGGALGAPAGPPLDNASRERGFVQAVGAAGLLHSVARACRDGRLSSCGCAGAARPGDLRPDWLWAGCGDDLEYAYRFSQAFVDVRERERGRATRARRLVNLHNNEAGRRAVIRRSKLACKCHGLSGGCSLVTCWQQLASFGEIGNYLLDKYDGATEVKVNRRGRLSIKEPRLSLPTADDLVYLDDSPNYCLANSSLGSLGTRGRTCNRTSSGVDGCNLLCCGRGYNTQKSAIDERCDCKFHWCCHVQCSKCTKNVDLHSCK